MVPTAPEEAYRCVISRVILSGDHYDGEVFLLFIITMGIYMHLFLVF